MPSLPPQAVEANGEKMDWTIRKSIMATKSKWVELADDEEVSLLTLVTPSAFSSTQKQALATHSGTLYVLCQYSSSWKGPDRACEGPT